MMTEPTMFRPDAVPLVHGHTWEDMVAGSAFRTARRTITEADLVAFVSLVGANEPLFYDAGHAAEGNYAGRLVPGMLTFSYAEGLVIQTGSFHGTGLAFMHAELDVRRPVYTGDTIEVVVEVTESRASSRAGTGVVAARNTVCNQRGETVLEYTPVRLVRGRDFVAAEQDGQPMSAPDRLQELLDRQEINDVLVRYCRGVDRCDVDLISSAYHPDAIDYHGAITASGADIGPILVEKLRSQHVAMRHQISNSTVELNGDEAAAETYYVAEMLSVDDDGVEVLRRGAGRYIDRLERRDGIWRIAQRTVVTYWAHDVALTDPRPTFTSPPSFLSKQDISYANFDDVRGGSGVTI